MDDHTDVTKTRLVMRERMTSIVLCGALLLSGAFLAVLPAGCDDDETVDDMSEDELIGLCRDMMEIYCEKGFECAPALAPAFFMIPDASQCDTWAVVMCTPDDDEPDDGGTDDDCTIEDWPTEADIRSCMAAIDAAECADVMTVAESGICAEVSEQLECEEEGGGDGDADVDSDVDSDADLDSDADGDSAPEVDTEGCVAAVAASCGVAAECVGDYPRLPAAIVEGVENCDATVAASQASIESTCEAYLTDGVAADEPAAMWLNDASAAEAETCVSNQSCDRDFILEVIGGLTATLATGDTSSLATALAPMLEG